MSGGQDQWRVRGTFGDVEIELYPRSVDAAARDRSLRALAALLHDLGAHRPEAHHALLEVHTRLRCDGGYSVRPDLREISAELRNAVCAGTLLLRTREKRAVSAPVAVDEEDALGPEPEPTAWIELELVDDGGKPVAGVDYRIECDDGRVRTGTTNASGKVREEGLHAGSCKVSFPRLHGPDWKKAG